MNFAQQILFAQRLCKNYKRYNKDPIDSN